MEDWLREIQAAERRSRLRWAVSLAFAGLLIGGGVFLIAARHPRPAPAVGSAAYPPDLPKSSRDARIPAALRQRWQQLPDTDRARLRARWRGLSPDDKERVWKSLQGHGPMPDLNGGSDGAAHS